MHNNMYTQCNEQAHRKQHKQIAHAHTTHKICTQHAHNMQQKIQKHTHTYKLYQNIKQAHKNKN